MPILEFSSGFAETLWILTCLWSKDAGSTSDILGVVSECRVCIVGNVVDLEA